MRRINFSYRTSGLWLIIAVMVATIGIAPSKVIAADTIFRSINNQLFYAPETACTTGAGEGTSSLVGNDNLEKILRFYVGKGLSLVQAAGIAGNYKQESGFNPSIIQGGAIAGEDYAPVNSVGFGIAQWTFTSRQAPLVALAKSTNRPINDLSLQLDYSWQELNGSHKYALGPLKATTDPVEAAFVFHRDYEGSADTLEMIRVGRGGVAQTIYNEFKSKIPDGSTAEASTIPGTSLSCTGDGKGAGVINGFTVYDQYDPDWANIPYGISTVGPAGCGPAAMAMIITSLTKQRVTPKETAEYGNINRTARDDGLAGSKHNLHTIIGAKWGLRSVAVGKDVAKINQGIKDGGLLILSGTGAAPFTDLGHFIVVRAVTPEGKWLIGDSNGVAGQENSKKEWDPTEVLEKVDSYSHMLFNDTATGGMQ